MNLPSLRFLIEALLKVCTRFPLTMLSAASTVVAMWIIIGGEVEANDPLSRLALVGAIGISLTIALTAMAEARQLQRNIARALQAAGLFSLAALWHWFPDLNAPDIEYRGMPQYAASVAVLHLLCSVIPFWGRGNVRDFWIFNRTLLTNIILGAAFSAVLFISLCLAILALNELFDLNIDARIYVRLFVFMVGFFHTAYFLFHFPEKFDSVQEDTNYHTIFKNLCKYILVPVVGLYFVILYAYSVKIVANWELPRGWVASLILGFSVAGILTYLLNYYLNEHSESSASAFFHKWFWPVLLPMTLLLFVAINRRIDDYGVTEARFMVASLGVWLFVNSVYFVLSRKDDIRFIPGSLALFGLLWIAMGGFVSDANQKKRLISAMEVAGRFENGQIRPDSTAIDSTSLRQIKSAVEFFGERGSLKILDPYLPVPADSLLAGEKKYLHAGRFLAWLGVRDSSDISGNLLIISLNKQNPDIDIRNYEHLTVANLTRTAPSCEDTTLSHHCFSLDATGKYIIRSHLENGNHAVVDSFNLAPLFHEWNDLHLKKNENELYMSDKRTDLTGKNGKIGLVPLNAAAAKGDSLILDNGQFYILFNNY